MSSSISSTNTSVGGDVYGTSRVVLPVSNNSGKSYLSATYAANTPITQLTNTGSGYQVYAGFNSQSIPQFRTLLAGSGVTLTQETDTITINLRDATDGQSTVSFLNLSDCPHQYGNNAHAALTVNASSTGLTFTKLSNVAVSGSYNDLLNLPTGNNDTLATLADVSISAIQDGQVLQWNANASKFVNAFTASSGGGSVTNVTSSSNVITVSNSQTTPQLTFNPGLVSLNSIGGLLQIAQIVPGQPNQVLGTDSTGHMVWTTPRTTITGDITTAPGTNSLVATLATVNSNPGTFAGITINNKGLVTSAIPVTTIAGYGITDALGASSSITIDLGFY